MSNRWGVGLAELPERAGSLAVGSDCGHVFMVQCLMNFHPLPSAIRRNKPGPSRPLM